MGISIGEIDFNLITMLYNNTSRNLFMSINGVWKFRNELIQDVALDTLVLGPQVLVLRQQVSKTVKKSWWVECLISRRCQPTLDRDHSWYIVILNKRHLSYEETVLLSQGFNFSVVPKRTPMKEFISSTESLAKWLERCELWRGTLLQCDIQRCVEVTK